MEISKHNIISQIENSDEYFIINILSGNADIIDKSTLDNFLSKNLSSIDEFIEKGYYINIEEEKQLLQSKYLDFIDQRDSDEIQIFFVPWYGCNFNCTYCFQDEYTNPKTQVSQEITDAFFKYISNEFAGRRKYVTLFGGEPLLLGNNYYNHISYFLNKSKQANLDIAIVTNGYNLLEYVDLIKDYNIREVQVTLDGIDEVHDSRRKLKGGGESFEKIIKGIDECLKNEIPINLRVVIDKENIVGLVALSDFAIQKKWTSNTLFKTQLGRNYELHHCQTLNNKLFTRISMYHELYKLILENKQILEFHKPAFSISKFLFENGELPPPLFDSCTGTKTEWAFDYTGAIYSCTATVGKSGEELGTYFPEITKKENIICEWENRDTLSIEKCKDCNVALACGGGCAAVAKNKFGTISSPDCRPIEDLLKLGFSLYQG